jgi:urease accessory protein UreE
VHIIRQRLEHPPQDARRVAIFADRHQLAKTRWRASAEDGVAFAFDLRHPLRHGDAVFADAGALYWIQQKPEPVLDAPAPTDWRQAALLGWSVGNLHQPMELLSDGLRVQDDSAMRNLFAQLGLPAEPREAVFQPTKSGHAHGH